MTLSPALAIDYAIVSTIENTFLNDLGNGYVREFIKQGALFIDYDKVYIEEGRQNGLEAIKRLLQEGNRKVVIFQSGPTDFHFSPEFFAELQKKYFMVMTLGDTDHYFYTRDIYYAQSMDLVIVYDCLSRYMFRRYGIKAVTLYSSYDTTHYKKIPGLNRDLDVSFVGDIANKFDRKVYVDTLSNNGIRVDIFGTGTVHGQVSLDEMVRIFNRSKINLNFTSLSSYNDKNRELKINRRIKQMKGRIAEVALCGGFVLSEYVPGIEEVFELEKEMAVFSTSAELLEKTRYYLAHDDIRNEIAEKGYLRACKDYELSSAVQQWISIINAARSRVKKDQLPIAIDKDFEKQYITFRFKLLSRFIKAGSINHALQEVSLIVKSRNIDIVNSLRFISKELFPFLSRILRRIKNAIQNNKRFKVKI